MRTILGAAWSWPKGDEKARNENRNGKTGCKTVSSFCFVLRSNPCNFKGLGVAGGRGFEPRLTESESAVLPLNYPPPAMARWRCGREYKRLYPLASKAPQLPRYGGAGARPPAPARPCQEPTDRPVARAGAS